MSASNRSDTFLVHRDASEFALSHITPPEGSDKQIPAKLYAYEYPRPALTVDLVVAQALKDDQKIRVLLIRRKNDPWQGMLALPGGFVNDNENTVEAALRELHEETGLVEDQIAYMMPVGLADAPDRDPRGRVVSATFFALVDEEVELKAGDDADDARWYEAQEVLGQELAADHLTILIDALTMFSEQNQ